MEDASRYHRIRERLFPRPPIMQLGCLDGWQEFLGKYPREMHDLRVFKCKQMHLFVIPGLIEDDELIGTGELVGGM
jgi:hypothetical protein